jgi:hypothetical protein
MFSEATCGNHINKWYDVDSSSTKVFYDCKKEKSCECTDGGKCLFMQSYLEGSMYQGFWVKDVTYFGDNSHPKDAFKFSFGCVKKETRLFYSQKADGILGMGMGGGHSINAEQPIYDAMFDEGIINKRMFNLCLGKNGGYF